MVEPRTVAPVAPPELFGSERLVFALHRPENFDALHRWQNDRALLDLTDDEIEIQTEEQTRAALERWTGSPREDIEHLAIHARGGALIGFAQVAFIDRHHGRCKLAIVLGERQVWGQGLGSEAIRRLTRHCFEDLGLNRVAAEIFAFNERSIRAFEAAGFRREGVLREHVRRGERRWDQYLYGLLRSEWTG